MALLPCAGHQVEHLVQLCFFAKGVRTGVRTELENIELIGLIKKFVGYHKSFQINFCPDSCPDASQSEVANGAVEVNHSNGPQIDL